MMPKIKIFSFFSGCGFLDLGFENTGFEVVFVNEKFPPFMTAYRYARQLLEIPEPEYGYLEDDLVSLSGENRKINLQELIKDAAINSDFIGFIGGPPCPDFSVGGKNRGKNGENGKLSDTYIELICQQQPDFFVFENVKGLWSTRKHRAFYEEIKRKVYRYGYIITERLINAIEYGVPQDRHRIILIGFRCNLLRDKGFDINYTQVIPENIFPWEKYVLHPQNQVFSYPWPQTNTFVENSEIDCPDGIPKELTVEYWFRQNNVVSHPNSEHYFQPRAGLVKFEKVAEGDDGKKSYKRLHRWRYSPTACYGNNEVHLHPYKVRRLSAAEALAIQSLPKKFALPSSMTLTHQFKTIGNGVPYLAAQRVAKTILDFLDMNQIYDREEMNHQLELPLVYSPKGKYRI
ncbi:DNA cytosine methyltransferase [Okeania sp. KiyG1]|uniref:DNA cytosine methyltransferase n=1 Tax=Okeania sp. KiyG1 TaxID=2720165 RepID=UPI0019228631|nr:DNA cytosine methyltransferase [Okeania sp. KiyG1]GGA37465.1 restriction endonuclease subunit M [Okeania sp. KiyG1]